MIQIGDQTYSFSDPVVIAVLAAVAAFLLIVLLLVLSLRAVRRSADPVIFQMSELGRSVQALQSGQEQLTGGLRSVSDAQATAQSQVIQTMEMRLATVQQQMQERLHENALKSSRALSDMQERMNQTLTGGSEKTTKSLTELQERLATIDRAQENITKLSGDVLSLQDILSNKQTRGAFGEIQLTDIVSKALPRDSYTLQATLSNGKRADCLIHLPNPPGPIAIDAKFPLEAYEALRAAETQEALNRAATALRQAVRVHIRRLRRSIFWTARRRMGR